MEVSMTVRELINRLEDIEEKDKEIIFFTDEEGNDAFVDVDIQIYDESYIENEDESEYELGTVLVYPSEWMY